jgi:hypothetical protein
MSRLLRSRFLRHPVRVHVFDDFGPVIKANAITDAPLKIDYGTSATPKGCRGFVPAHHSVVALKFPASHRATSNSRDSSTLEYYSQDGPETKPDEGSSMTYIFEVISNWPHVSSPVNLSGNAFDVSSLTATCPVCGVAAKINSGQAIGLDRSDPGFENRIEELAADFGTLSYYLATVSDGKWTLEIRFRKQITLDFDVFCKTCSKGIPVVANLRETLKRDHKRDHADHDIQIGTVGDAPVYRGSCLKLSARRLSNWLGSQSPLSGRNNRGRVAASWALRPLTNEGRGPVAGERTPQQTSTGGWRSGNVGRERKYMQNQFRNRFRSKPALCGLSEPR